MNKFKNYNTNWNKKGLSQKCFCSRRLFPKGYLWHSLRINFLTISQLKNLGYKLYARKL